MGIKPPGETHMPVATTCPYLGLHTDRESFVSYPSQMNCCHHTKNRSHINKEYQENVCLTPQYAQCPVFRSPKETPLPAHAGGSDMIGMQRRKLLISRFLIVAVLLISAGLVWFFFGDQITGQVFASPVAVIEGTYTAPTYEYAIPTSEEYKPSTFSTQLIPPTPQAPALLWQSTPGPDRTAIVATLTAQLSLKMYRVVLGDNLEALARDNFTTSQAIIDINAKMHIPLYVDEVIVIPVYITDVSDLPKFEVRMIESKTAVSVIADLNDCSETLFAQFNQPLIVPEADGGYIPADTFVLIPRPVNNNQP